MTGSLLDTLFLNDVPLLDVRAPCEFEKGAFPGAVNIPILDDSQREQVGLCYKQQGQAQAIELAHRLISPQQRQARIEQWSNFVKANPSGYLYCFRGGKRSQFAQQWLNESQLQYPLVPGGYKQMRNHLLDKLDYHSRTLPFTLVSGKTGSGKTMLLPRLPHYIDLEALANHRGSSFGATLNPQPSVITFENCLSIELLKQATLQPHTIYLEDEGKLIGRLAVPQSLRERMLSLPCVLLTESIARRVAVSEKDYISELLALYRSRYGNEDGLLHFINHHKNALHKIRKRFGNDLTKKTEAAFDDGVSIMLKEGHTAGFYSYIETLLIQYYDPMYEYQFKSKNRQILFSGTADDIVQWCCIRNQTQPTQVRHPG